MVFSNLGFEDEDAAALGFPDIWTVAIVNAASSVAGYDDESAAAAGPDTREDFEGGWSTNASYTFAYADPVDFSELKFAIYDTALPDSEVVEDFEEGWSTNQSYLFVFGSIVAASYDVGTPQDVEDFEEEWDSNESYDFTMGATAAASYDTGTPEDVEDFEEEWDSNESYDFTMGATDAATYFSGGTNARDVEDFNDVILEASVTVVPGTDRVVRTAHGLTNGEKVSFRNEGGTLPAGLNTGFLYFVIGATANDFQVSQTSGGTAVDITDNGVGTHFMIPDQTVFWTSDLGAL